MRAIFLLQKYYFLLLTVLSVGILLIVYSMEFFFQFPPCKLCIYQRVPYLFTLIVGMLSFFQINKRYLHGILFFIFFVSLIVSLYHSLVERNLVNFEIGCTSMNQDFSNIDDLRKYLDEDPCVYINNIHGIGFSLQSNKQ